MVLAVSGAHQVTHDDAPQLYNVVEEMTIAAGLPQVPAVYVIEDPAPNAFATGRDPQHASVAVTRGLLQRWTARSSRASSRTSSRTCATTTSASRRWSASSSA